MENATGECILPYESYGSTVECGMFQHLMVASIPPEKQQSPSGATASDRTGPIVENTYIYVVYFTLRKNSSISGAI